MTSTPPLTDAEMIAFIGAERRRYLDQAEREADAGYLQFAAICRERADKFDAIAARLEQTGWQPIATAPKDGTEVLLTDGKYKRTGWWSKRIECWSIDSAVSMAEPTYWTALPAPPATSESQ